MVVLWPTRRPAPAGERLANGWTLRSISNRSPGPGDDPYNGLVQRIGYTHDVDRLATELSSCRVLVSNFWSRHDKAPIGRRGPWLSHLQVVDQSAVLIKAAARAGVERLVWTSRGQVTRAGGVRWIAAKIANGKV